MKKILFTVELIVIATAFISLYFYWLAVPISGLVGMREAFIISNALVIVMGADIIAMSDTLALKD